MSTRLQAGSGNATGDHDSTSAAGPKVANEGRQHRQHRAEAAHRKGDAR